MRAALMALAALALAGCSNTPATNGMEMIGHIEYRTVQFDGHYYTEAHDPSVGIAIAHSPSCPCRSRAKRGGAETASE